MRRRESLEAGPPESAGCTEPASKGNIPYVVAISHYCPPSKQPQNLGGQILSDPILPSKHILSVFGWTTTASFSVVTFVKVSILRVLLCGVLIDPVAISLV